MSETTEMPERIGVVFVSDGIWPAELTASIERYKGDTEYIRADAVQPQWVPVAERMPEALPGEHSSGDVWVTVRTIDGRDIVISARYTPIVDQWRFEGLCWHEDVLAWMPKQPRPEPYAPAPRPKEAE